MTSTVPLPNAETTQELRTAQRKSVSIELYFRRSSIAIGLLGSELELDGRCERRDGALRVILQATHHKAECSRIWLGSQDRIG